MGKFIIGTFAIMAWAFYVMSGGPNFVPQTRMAAADAPQPEVTRAQTTEMAAVASPADSASVDAAVVTAEPAAAEIAPRPIGTADAAAQPIAISLETAPVFDGETSESGDGAPSFTSLSAPAPAAVASPNLASLREVAGRAVNMREGPSTSYNVIDTLPQGTQTEVVDSDGAGWVRVRVVETGQMGWMAERLLTNG